MPTGNFTKRKLKARVDALRSIMLLPTFEGAGFGHCTVFDEGTPNSCDMVYSAFLVHRSPVGFLKAVSLLMKKEIRVLNLDGWVDDNGDPEKVFPGGRAAATGAAIEAINSFKDWYGRARDCVELDLVRSYGSEGETPLGKGKMKLLERRFRARWDEDAQEDSQGQDSAREAMERFKEFLS